MAKTEMIRARVEPELKSQAEEVFSRLGLTPTEAITLLYGKVIEHRGLPFAVKIPDAETTAALRQDRASDRINGTPIDRSSTVSRILANLHDRIVGGNMKPGSPLPAERELAAELGVSRFSLREALRVAESQGLVKISHGKRTQVATETASSVAAAWRIALRRGAASPVLLTEARLAVEVEIARLAAERATPDMLAALQETIDRHEQAAPGDAETRVAYDVEFHRLLACATGNPVFEMMLSPLVALLEASLRLTNFYWEELRQTNFQHVPHRRVLRAVAARDASAAANEMRAHLESVQRGLRDRQAGDDVPAAANTQPRS